MAASSALMMIGVVPAKMYKASLDVLRYALAISMFMSFCTLMYLRLLYSYVRASIQTGAPYSKSGMYVCMYVLCMYVCVGMYV